jgi:hypothetical protein
VLYASWIFAAIALLIWLFGVSGAFAAGPGIHVLLVLAIATLLSGLFTRPRTV